MVELNDALTSFAFFLVPDDQGHGQTNYENIELIKYHRTQTLNYLK